jgi:hypothetical protein
LGNRVSTEASRRFSYSQTETRTAALTWQGHGESCPLLLAMKKLLLSMPQQLSQLMVANQIVLVRRMDRREAHRPDSHLGFS